MTLLSSFEWSWLWTFAALLTLGLVTGFLAGLLGIGGGMVMVPFLTYLISQQGVGSALAVKMAIATSMATIVFTSMSSVRAHHKKGAVRWDIVRGLTPGIVMGALVASLGVFSVMKGTTLAFVFAGFVGFSSLQMFRNKQPEPGRMLPRTPGLAGAGGVIGFASGLVGAGGGFISVPFMAWCNVAIHQAVATSAALGFPIAVANAVGYVWSGQQVNNLPAGAIGYIYMPALVIIAIASVCMAPLGAQAAHALPVAKLKRVFATLLLGLAVYMAYKGLAA
ncbi:MAG: putative membrane protein YfcA [Burkholderiaceae bacterium]|jgi:uncharacterized membrane protein YfcA